MPEIKNTFSQGKMNKDLDARLVPNGQYRDAMNVQVSTSDDSNVGVVQSLLGNTLKWSGHVFGETYQAGTSCVGAVADEQNNKIYYFVKSDVLDAVLEYDFDSETNDVILVDANQNVLNFTGDIITAINVIDGLLYWTDNNSEPKKLNINTFKTAATLSTNIDDHTQIHGRDVEEKDITVIKKKPTKAPVMTFSTEIRDGHLGNLDADTEQYYGIARDRNLSLKQVGDEANIFMELQSINFPFDYKVGDVLVATLESNPLPPEGAGEEEVRMIVKEVFGAIYSSDYTTTGKRQRLRVTIEYVSPSVTTGLVDWNIRLISSDVTINDKKFFRFATRFKYTDKEYSAIGPWTNVAFLAGNFLYAPTKEPYNLGMQNATKSITLQAFAGGDTPDDVEEIDILYKEENSNTVYVIDTLKKDDPDIETATYQAVDSNYYNNWEFPYPNTMAPFTAGTGYSTNFHGWSSSGFIYNTYTGKYIITSQNIISALPEEQLLRTWDSVPIKALAQEIVSNRLIYGNYTKNYSLTEKPTLSCQFINKTIWPGLELDPGYLARGRKSIKTLRNYQIGVLFSDDYGRETPVFTNEESSLTSPFHFDYPKQITAFLKSFNPPDWAKYYKFYIKDTSDEYYNLAMDRAYPANDDQNLWISFPSSDRNKIDEESYLILKKPRLGEPAINAGEAWKVGVGSGLNQKNKYKVIDIKNEAPDFIKNKYHSLGTASKYQFTNDAGTTVDVLLQKTSSGNAGLFFESPYSATQDVPDMLPGAGVSYMKIDKFIWYSSQNRFNNQDLKPKLSEGETVLAIQFSIPGIEPGTKILSKKYDILSCTLDSTTVPTGIEQAFYAIKLKEPIEDGDSWIRSAANTLDPNLTVEIFKVENKDLQEFEGRFFVKIMGDVLTKNYVETRLGQWLVLSNTKFLTLTDRNLVSGDGTTYNSHSSLLSNTFSEWETLLYQHDNGAAGFFIDATFFASGQTTANNSVGCSGIMTGTPTDIISDNLFNATNADYDELLSGLYDGIFTASGDKYAAGVASDLSDMGERSFRTQPQELLTPIGSAPTTQLGTRRYVYHQNKHYLNLSFSGCGITMAGENENFPVKTAPSTSTYYQFNPSTCGPTETVSTNWTTGYTINSGGGSGVIKYVPDLNGTSNQGWIRFPNYNDGALSAFPFDTNIWPSIDPDLTSPTNYYNSSSKKKWRTMWDPTVDASGNEVVSRKKFVDNLEVNSQFYFEDDPDQIIYTITRVEKLRFYNHTSWRTTWLEDTGGNADSRLAKRHRVGSYSNNSVEEALLSYLNDTSGTVSFDIDGNAMDMGGAGTRLAYLQQMIYQFGHRNNRRVTYVLELDKDPTQETWYPTNLADVASFNVLKKMIFVSNDNSGELVIGLPQSPAVWETEPKEKLELDLYYEASDNIPLTINENTRELFAPSGSTIWCINQAETPITNNEAWRHDLLQGPCAQPTIHYWETPSSGVYNGEENIFRCANLWATYTDDAGNDCFLTQGLASNYTPSADDVWVVGDDSQDFSNLGTEGKFLIRIDKGSGDWVTAEVEDFRVREYISGGKTNWVINRLKIKEQDNHQYSVGLNWFNCIDFGNGVESNRIRDDFNDVLIRTGIKASTTTIKKYEQEVKENGLIFSSIYSPMGNINGFSEFIAAQDITKDLPLEYGSIQKLFTRDNDLLSFCEDKVTRIYSDKDILYNADGNAQLTASNRVLGQSDPFEGEFGISKNPESFASESYRAYFVDAKRRSVLRLSKDGITRISDYGMSDWFSDNIKPENTLIGSFDYDKQEYNLAGVNNKVVSFSETVKGWVSFKSFNTMQFGISLSGKYFTFNNGKPYEHHSNSDRNVFYNNHTASSITAILNQSPEIVKDFKTLSYDGTQSKIVAQTTDQEADSFGEYYNMESKEGWYVGTISTDSSLFSYDTTNSPFDFKNKEDKWFNYIRGTSIEESGGNNFDLSNFNFQGIGEKIIP